MKEFKYKSKFAAKIELLSDEKANKFLSLASQDNLKKYLPKSIKLEEKVDCIAVAGQAFLANKLNLNGDSVDSETAIRIANLFPMTFIDANHDRTSIVGVVLTASYTDEETNQELTEEQVKSYTKPFAVTIGGVVWKVANKKLTEALEDSNFKDKLYFSWELGYSSMKLIEIPQDKFNLTEGKVIEDATKINEYTQKLEENSRLFLSNGNKIGKIIIGDCLPMGLGIVTDPAGQLNPLVSENPKKRLEIEAAQTKEKGSCPECDEEMEIDEDDEHEISCAKCGKKSKAKMWKKGYKVSSSEIANALERVGLVLSESTESLKKLTESFTNAKNGVIENKENQNKVMTITKIEDLNDENLKQLSSASVIKDLWRTELDKANQKFLDEQNKLKQLEAERQQSAEALKAVQEELKKLQEAAAAKEAAELFNQRMTYFDDTYELSKDERQVIASEIKDLNQESFDKVKNKYDVFLKEKSKASIQAKKDADEKAKKEAEEAAKQKQSNASKTDDNGNIIDNALANGSQANAGIPNAQAGTESFLDQYKEAFNPKNCVKMV